MSYSAQGQKLYEEAVRTIPGVLGCKDRRDYEGMHLLLDGYFKKARDLGLKDREAWQALFNASIHWSARLADRYATATDKSFADVIQQMGTAAMMWRSDAADPS